MLIGYAVDSPAIQQPDAACRIDTCALGEGLVNDVPVDIDGLDMLPEVFNIPQFWDSAMSAASSKCRYDWSNVNSDFDIYSLHGSSNRKQTKRLQDSCMTGV